ncbi:YidH family protein [Amnibacterium endophyticum]|uniref:YidH family protein n=1 Tax=Amnibacterium endophyticum TaxID=2109337 RepID=A0ABW4L9Z0_9MICO
MFELGEEPDPRFTLANERTFLAWIRTGLALIAGGVAVDAVRLPIAPAIRVAVALVLLLFGLLIPLLAWLSWAATERALRLGRPLPGSAITLPLAVGVLIVGVLIAVGVLVG